MIVSAKRPEYDVTVPAKLDGADAVTAARLSISLKVYTWLAQGALGIDRATIYVQHRGGGA
jgi:hypothetical protein